MTVSAEVLTEIVGGHFTPPPRHIGVAVSGGSDSLALMLILADWARAAGVTVSAATVDHGLRPESAAEAEFVAGIAKAQGLGHTTLNWQGWDGSGNLSDQARRARYGLLQDWAEAQGISHVALGHTADDQAETFLMRLAREAGPDGLAAMRVHRKAGAMTFSRPALSLRRADLQAYLQARGQAWISDPTNEDVRYDRVRARAALTALEPLGVTVSGLTAVAQTMVQVREALNWYTFLTAKDLAQVQVGDIILDRKAWRTLPDEIARRLLQHALIWVASADYGPRRAALALLIEAIRAGDSMTLHGCQVTVTRDKVRIFREYDAVAGVVSAADDLWDGRWRLRGPWSAGTQVRALGPEGLEQCPGWREGGLPHASVLSTPAVWRGDTLIAAPLAGRADGWSAEIEGGQDAFFAAILSR